VEGRLGTGRAGGPREEHNAYAGSFIVLDVQDPDRIEVFW
jgi:hypothetical protein